MSGPEVVVNPLTEAEFDRLEEFFARQKSPQALNVEEMDGFFSALLVGPEFVPSREYLPVVLGEFPDDDTGDGSEGSTAVFADLDEANEFLSLSMRHWNTIARAVQHDELYLPVLYQQAADDPPGPPEGHRWARGFMRGVNLRRESWRDLILDEEEGSAILPMALLSGEMDATFLERQHEPEDVKQLLGLLTDGLNRIQRYFAPVREANADLAAAEAIVEPVMRRSPKKIGRNEPCPCGSGKKYKHCCGARH